jgi:Glycosyltransferase family 87
MQFRRPSSNTVQPLIYIICGAVVIWGPPIFWFVLKDRASLWEHGASDIIFALWSVLGLLALSVCFLFDLKKPEALRQRLGLYAVLLTFILTIGASSHDYRLHDYGAYEKSAIEFVRGKNLYVTAYHLNFPFIAESLVAGYQGLRVGLSVLHLDIPEHIIFGGVFYLYQCAQLVLVGLGYWLSSQLLVAFGLNKRRAVFICTAWWLLSWPVYLTIEKGQINILMLDLTLLALLWIESHPIAAGLSLSVSFFLKFYPIAIVIAAVISRRWKLVGAFLAGVLLMIGIQTLAGGCIIWSEFIEAIQQRHLSDPLVDFEAQMQPSVSNAAFILFRVFSPVALGRVIQVVSVVIAASILFWFGWRVWVRERIYQQELKRRDKLDIRNLELARFYAHVADLLIVALLVSPHVWQNHYVMALPTILWALTRRNCMSPLLLAAIGLILVGNHFEYGTPAFLAGAFLKPLGLILLAISQNPRDALPCCGPTKQGGYKLS